MFWTRVDRFRVIGLSAAFVTLSLAAAGCGRENADQALDRVLSEQNQSRATIAKFSGTVTVDGQRPVLGPKQSLLVILYDTNHPPTAKTQPICTACNKDGEFEFTTYKRGDGVATGSYIVLFAELTAKPNAGFFPPDGLKNLYNDPDTSQFKYDLAPPGKTDYTFDLVVGAKEPKSTPGPHAITRIKAR